MADNVSIDIRSLNRFLNKVVQPYLLKKAEEIAEEARRNAPIGATSDLRNNITVSPGANGGVKISLNSDHAGFVTQGTGPQANPPRAPYYPRLRRRGLIAWSDSVNLNPYKVAHGISQKGTKPNPFFEESIASVLNRFDFKWIRKDLNL